MTRRLVPSLAVLVLSLATNSFANCTALSTPGVNLCFPSQGSTVSYPATFEFAANTGSSAVTGVAIYDNGKKIDDFTVIPSRLVDGAVLNGSHKVTVKVWDKAGHVYSASKSFKVVGYGVGSCTASGVGVNICYPVNGSLQPNTGVPVSMRAQGNAAITSWKLYVDGKAVMNSYGSEPDSVVTSISTTAGTHHLSVVAWDTNGAVYKASRDFTAFYNYDCNPISGACTPGVIASSPSGFGPYVAVSTNRAFLFKAQVVKPQSTIKSMTVMVDGAVVARASGQSISKTLTTDAGSHNITVQAVDSAGKTYATYGNIDVQ